MGQIVFCRELRLKNLEVFHLRKGNYGKVICFMLIVDFRRPCTLNDFPYLKGIESEEEFGSSNFIKVIFLHHKPIKTKLKDKLINLTDSLLARRNDCHWNCSFEKIKKKKFNKMFEDNTYMFESFTIILKKYGYQAELENITDEHFNYLSQD